MNTTFCKFCVSLKRYCFVNPFPCAALLIASALWTLTLALAFFGRGSPIDYLPGSSVEPRKAYAGQTVLITRYYRVNRIEPIIITRRMERGDCKNMCDRIDLPTSKLTNYEVNHVSRRPLELPANISPGVWVLRFEMNWDDLLGRSRSIEIPPLTIEVLP